MTIIEEVNHAIIVEGSRQAGGITQKLLDQQLQLQLQKLQELKNDTVSLFPSLSSVSSEFQYNHEEVVPYLFSFASHINDGRLECTNHSWLGRVWNFCLYQPGTVTFRCRYMRWKFQNDICCHLLSLKEYTRG